METLAYLHLSANYEDPNSEPHQFKFSPKMNRNPLPSSAWIRLLSVVLALSVIGTAGHALALQRGNSGSQVATLQRNLKIAGFYNGPVTGYYGQLTQASVSSFQRAVGLRADGVAGSRTLAALENRGGEYDEPITGGGFGSSTLKRGSSGSSVTRLQNALKGLGYYNGPITGYYGRLTKTSVTRFQQSRGLFADGIVGQRTKAALAAD